MNAPPELYLAVREREGRLYADEVVARLPEVDRSHPHRAEWRARAASARRLIAYFQRQSRSLTILELGCGNGWLASALAGLPGSRVYGLDTNGLELTQAVRVFDGTAFLAADVLRPPFPDRAFDAVVMASSVQYFDDLGGLLRALKPLLRPGGEVHIVDSPVYADEEVPAARRRSAAYYGDLGIPAMAGRYHHHTWAALMGFDFDILYDPSSVLSRLRRRLGSVDSPFPWLRVRFTT